MPNFNQIIKNKVRGAIEVLPMGRDIFLYLTRNPSRGISYNGMYLDYTEVSARVASRKNGYYDIVNEKKAAHKENENAKLEAWFQDADYPLLFWTSQLLHDGIHLLELGGSIGHFYYGAKQRIKLPDGMRWTVAELPGAVKLGQELAEERGEDCLKFLDSANIKAAAPAELFITAGTLQYIEKALWVILSELQTMPEHVLVNNLPTHKNRSFWTLQNLSVCEVPYRIYALDELKTEMKRIGYKLIHSWSYPRYIEIPFHRDLVIEGYLGFYFQKQCNNTT